MARTDFSTTKLDLSSITGERSALWLDRILAAGVLVFLLLLPFHLVIKNTLAEPLGTYWKEGLLAVLVLVWGLRSLIARRPLLTGTLLDWAALAYAGLILLRLLLDGNGTVSWWGAYMSILYLPLVWLVPQALRFYPRGIKILIAGLAAVGGLVALGGVLEFILNRPLFPSAEIMERQGFPDVFVYGTQLRRVYFVLDSPTTLANTLALLLPLSLVQIFLADKNWKRALYGAASALMFVCILFTFSRGIWAALALAFLLVVVYKYMEERNRKFLLGMAGVAGAGLLIMLVVLFSQPVSNPDQYTLEFIQSEYRSAPLLSAESLIDVEPVEGDPQHQEWLLYDPIDQFEDWREVIFTHPSPNQSAEVIYRLEELPEDAALRFAIALAPEVWTPEKGDGVSFKLFVKEPQASQGGEVVFERYLNPKFNPNDRRWRNYIVDLSDWEGKAVDLYLIVDPGPEKDDAFDWAGWADLELGSLDPTFIAAHAPKEQNPVVDHLASFTDWVKDETNRDRLAAWNLGLNAWQKNPLWGQGLGFTGAAAFRSMPETAIATESQVLKSLVELGIPGLLVWGFLWFAVGRLALNAYRQKNTPVDKWIVLSLIASLLIVFIEGLVYQNLEVKQVNAYFWTFVGMLAFINHPA